MPETEKLKIVYPAEGETEWYQTFVSLIERIEEFVYGIWRNGLLLPLFDETIFTKNIEGDVMEIVWSEDVAKIQHPFLATTYILNGPKRLSFKVEGYIGCVSSDIGKNVLVGNNIIGRLTSYNNTLRRWWVEGVIPVEADQNVRVENGVGQGVTETGSENSIKILDGEVLYFEIVDTDVAMNLLVKKASKMIISSIGYLLGRRTGNNLILRVSRKI